MPVITIAHEFGAGGETVGRLVAQRLNLEYLDSKIVDEVARQLKVGTEVVENYDEKTRSLLDRILRQLPTVDFSTPPGDHPQQAVTSDGVIVGRGGAYILRDQEDVLKVFRGRLRVVPSGGDDGVVGALEAEARKRLKQIDANQAA